MLVKLVRLLRGRCTGCGGESVQWGHMGGAPRCKTELAGGACPSSH